MEVKSWPKSFVEHHFHWFHPYILFSSILVTVASPHKGGGGKSIGMWVGIGVSIVVVLVLTVLLGVWCIRHKRLQRSFMEFTSSHYNSRTDNATFSGGLCHSIIYNYGILILLSNVLNSRSKDLFYTRKEKSSCYNWWCPKPTAYIIPRGVLVEWQIGWLHLCNRFLSMTH